jgi:16S rRNA (guanine(966)-N(2))-methyltransferase RsmD
MRIIAGSLRGRDLGAVPDGVRPTSDRIRESLFSSLGDVGGLQVLDLFAGTGALGLEAFSRGAASVTFVERSKRVGRELTKKLSRFHLEDEKAIRVLAMEATRAIRRLEADQSTFDLVFVDPPYAGDARETTLAALFGSSVLSPEATVVVEGPKRHPLPPLPGVRLLQERRYGDTLLTWLAAAGSIRE